MNICSAVGQKDTMQLCFIILTGGVFLEEKQKVDVTEAEAKIIRVIRSMEEGELKIIIKNNRPRKLEQIYTFSPQENMHRTKE